VQRDQAERIATLETENASLKKSQSDTTHLVERIQALEQHNAYLAARRRELVGQLSNLRTLHQEADNAFQMRAVDIQPEDLEGMLGVYSTMMTTAMHHHQRALAQMRANTKHIPSYMSVVAQTQASVMPAPVWYAYPPAYSEQGYCFAHNMPYCCRFCSK
jgi:hypothetical protein